MKLIRKTTNEAVQLENGFFWSDEFDWKPIEQTVERSISGNLIIQEGKKVSGRLITLVPAIGSMGWIKRADLSILKDWSALQNEQFTLAFEYPHDTRQFNVIFNHQDGALSDVKTVKGTPSISEGEYYSATLRFLEL